MYTYTHLYVQGGTEECLDGDIYIFTETKKQSPNTGARANNTLQYTSN